VQVRAHRKRLRQQGFETLRLLLRNEFLYHL